jgi:hypothetical protein
MKCKSTSSTATTWCSVNFMRILQIPEVENFPAYFRPGIPPTHSPGNPYQIQHSEKDRNLPAARHSPSTAQPSLSCHQPASTPRDDKHTSPQDSCCTITTHNHSISTTCYTSESEALSWLSMMFSSHWNSILWFFTHYIPTKTDAFILSLEHRLYKILPCL